MASVSIDTAASLFANVGQKLIIILLFIYRADSLEEIVGLDISYHGVYNVNGDTDAESSHREEERLYYERREQRRHQQRNTLRRRILMLDMSISGRRKSESGHGHRPETREPTIDPVINSVVGETPSRRSSAASGLEPASRRSTIEEDLENPHTPNTSIVAADDVGEGGSSHAHNVSAGNGINTVAHKR